MSGGAAPEGVTFGDRGSEAEKAAMGSGGEPGNTGAYGQPGVPGSQYASQYERDK